MRIIEEEITFTDSNHPRELSKVAEIAQELIIAIAELRRKYREEGDLPLFPINSDYENLREIIDCIESEVGKFYECGYIKKEFIAYTDKEIREIIRNNELGDTGLDEWVEEGLLNIGKYNKC